MVKILLGSCLALALVGCSAPFTAGPSQADAVTAPEGGDEQEVDGGQQDPADGGAPDVAPGHDAAPDGGEGGRKGDAGVHPAPDGGTTVDAGGQDAAPDVDAGTTPDAGSDDAGNDQDAGTVVPEGGTDGGTVDAGQPDSGPPPVVHATGIGDSCHGQAFGEPPTYPWLAPGTGTTYDDPAPVDTDGKAQALEACGAWLAAMQSAPGWVPMHVVGCGDVPGSTIGTDHCGVSAVCALLAMYPTGQGNASPVVAACWSYDSTVNGQPVQGGLVAIGIPPAIDQWNLQAAAGNDCQWLDTATNTCPIWN